MQDLTNLYQKTILEHSRTPRNTGKLKEFSHSGYGDNPLCGDKIKLYVSLDSQGKLRDLSFEAEGCAILIACASLMSEAVKHKTVQDVHDLKQQVQQMLDNENYQTTDKTLHALSGVRAFPTRLKCVTLPWTTLMDTLHARHHTSTTE